MKLLQAHNGTAAACPKRTGHRVVKQPGPVRRSPPFGRILKNAGSGLPRGISGYTPAPSIRVKTTTPMLQYGGSFCGGTTGSTSSCSRPCSSRSSDGFTVPERSSSMMPAFPPVPDTNELVNKRTEAAESLNSNLQLGTLLAAEVIGDTLLITGPMLLANYQMVDEVVDFLGLDKVTAAVASAPFAAAALAFAKQDYYDSCIRRQ